ncbi:hypothetical protein [Glaciimonas soli]|nr:hypothetical protein [Glaciimonas soli]
MQAQDDGACILTKVVAAGRCEPLEGSYSDHGDEDDLVKDG